MSLSPLINADPQVQTHVVAAVLSLGLGPIAIYGRKWFSTRFHKTVGYVWVMAMAMTALSSFWISGIRIIGPFSPIHLLSIFVLVSLWRGIQFARSKQMARHQGVMRGLYWQGLMLAGVFTLIPGRLLSEVLFPNLPELAIATILLGCAVAVTSMFNTPMLKHAIKRAKRPV